MRADIETLPRLQRSGATRPGVGIVHLGLGAFFRGFGAVYVAEAMARSGGDWGIVGVSLRHADQRDRLKPQDFAYTCLELGPQGQAARAMEVVQDVLVAPEDPGAVLAVMADPAVRIVSLTVTEKGYCHFPSTGRLNPDHPDIAGDLADPAAPRSAPGFIVRALQMRRAAGLRPFTVLCCDNLPSNGKLAEAVVTDLARLVDPDLADWVAAECAFPCTMVDRIVPATTEADIERVGELTGRLDLSPVVHEPFRQWVVEDRFVDGARPDLGAVGVEMVEDVEPFELMKLRCLNGTHSALAYLGYLAGHETISATVADAAFAGFIRKLWDREIVPSLEAPPGTDLGDYTARLLERYANPGIRHRTWQIAMDGSQKLPQRILGTVMDNLEAGRGIAGLALVVAGWMRYVGGVDEKGGAIDVRDPLADRLRAITAAGQSPADTVAGLLGLEEVFPPALAADARFRAALTDAYSGLAEKGARAAVAEYGR